MALLSTPAPDPTFIAPDFSLRDVITDEVMTLSEQDLSRGFVVMFICNHCPYVQAIIEQIRTTTDTLASAGIPTFAIMSNNYEFVTEDSPDNMRTFAAEHGLTFPYLVDEDQSVAKAYGAVCTPDIAGFNAERMQQYRGTIDSLEVAMLSIKETGQGPSPDTYGPSSGCSIKWK